MKNKNFKTILISLVFVVFSLLLMFSQIRYGATIIGSDAIFHYNRFYDTAMQIKTGQFNYFMSTFGYQQSGRIINALYGPFFAYLQGLLVLISGTWFHYQLLSRFLLSLLASSGLYRLLRLLKAETKLAVTLSLFFLTTFAIQYWSLRQGFSSWGVAVFPWCLIPAVKTLQTQKIAILPLALAVSAIFQIHVLSTLLLILTYLPIYGYAFFKTPKKWQFINHLALSVGVFLLLTANVWLPLMVVGKGNTLIAPFINYNLPKATIDRGARDLLVQPFGLIALIIGQFILSIAIFLKAKPHQRSLHYLSLLAFSGMLLLSSSFFPWDKLVDQKIKLVELIQFPFRFFLIATVLLLLCLGITLPLLKRGYKASLIFLIGATLLGAYEINYQDTEVIQNQYLSNTPVQERKHNQLWGDADQIRASFKSTNLQDFLLLATKSTPDYLPLYHQTKKNKYNLYKELVIEQTTAFDKTVTGDSLTISWESKSEEEINLPIILYTNSKLTLNGQELELTTENLSPIGTPTVTAQAGQNQATLTYQAPSPVKWAIGISLLSWLVCLICGLRLLKYFFLKTLIRLTSDESSSFTSLSLEQFEHNGSFAPLTRQDTRPI